MPPRMLLVLVSPSSAEGTVHSHWGRTLSLAHHPWPFRKVHVIQLSTRPSAFVLELICEQMGLKHLLSKLMSACKILCGCGQRAHLFTEIKAQLQILQQGRQ